MTSWHKFRKLIYRVSTVWYSLDLWQEKLFSRIFLMNFFNLKKCCFLKNLNFSWSFYSLNVKFN